MWATLEHMPDEELYEIDMELLKDWLHASHG